MKRMYLKRISLNAITVAAVLLLATNFTFADEKADPPTITVSGSATENVVPDKVLLTASVTTRNKSLDDAVTENETKIKAVVEFLKSSGVEDKFIRTEVINIRPLYPERGQKYALKPQAFQANAPFQTNAPDLPRGNAAPNKEKDPFAKLKPIGYEVRRQFGITITKLDSFEKIYRGLIKAGINDIGGIQFESTDLRKHKDAARLKAITAAKEKAQALAGALGAKLAFVHKITETNFSHQPNRFSNVLAYSEAPASTMTAGTMEIKASVQVIFILGDNAME